MASTNKILLFKIASEINIGKDAIIQFLQSRGFDIANKPTAVLTEDMLEAVYEKFKKEKKAAEKQREKIEKIKSYRKPEPRGKEAPVKPEATPELLKIRETDKAVESKQPDAGFVHHVEETEVSHGEPVHEHKTPVVHEQEPEHTDGHGLSSEKEHELPPEETAVITPKVGEIIDIGQKQRPHGDFRREDRNRKDQYDRRQQPERAKETRPQQPEQKKEPELHVVPVETIEVAETHEPAIPGEIVPGDSITIPQAAEETETVNVQTEEGEEETATTGREESRSSRRRKKRKRLAEVELDGEDIPRLKGLTIVGKIDLKQGQDKKGKKVKKEKKKGFEEEEDASKGKKPLKLKKRGGKGTEKEPFAKDKPALDKKKKRRKSIRETISEEDIDRAIKETFAGMGESSSVSQRSRMRQRKRAEREEKEIKKQEELESTANVLELTEFVTTGDLANILNVNANEIILKCMGLGLMVSINQRLDKDTIQLIADDYGFTVEFLDDKAIQTLEEDEEEDTDFLMPRSPIVTIMDHVDHGKTSLLDFIREANVVAGEAGGITQHIGAYRVELPNGKHITFLDTPGHEAFTAMRARGAQVTDIVVLVVAADDSVMPQTIEAISHAQAANVPIVVAINKMDKPDAHPDRIKQQLADHGILVEDWGGKYQSVELSAKTGKNVDSLLEKILIEAEFLDLKANPDRGARATVIEAHMDKGLGVVSTVIVNKGTLGIGDNFVAGMNSGKVRAMFDERENKVTIAGPSIPVRVIGFNGLPEAGDILAAVADEHRAKEIANQRKQLKREQEFRQVRHVTLDDISNQIKIGGVKELCLIIKGDVGGSVEALSDSLLKLSRDEVRVVILHKGVGSITESDVMLAVASGAVVIGFQVTPTNQARKLAEKEAVDIRIYNIIYDCINEVKLALEGLLTPELKEDITSSVEIRKVFKINKLGVIAGCMVSSGKINRNDKVRVLRDGLPIFKGSLRSLKRGKDDVREVESGFECGIALEGFNDIEVGDVIESYKILEIKRTFA